ncbi:MAG: hypothetical protein A3F33_00580 [Candidatus Woykebacteria bacterium RIFCSPHIGHO2_12_FULL_43_10]|uniref:Glycosyltransferase family 1 protein n=1 Tax=Candidatus Woykebacteria bacterium RIFCSPLOWO2_01_FULL_43_14 TaxID=1802605 RepID=A0A1G1WVL6_9BACT|nr:MAG: hypothetical protein A2802_02740 [Candidatus Woykebacteria bacterium RIFCSPHIGHO2_01_FULL_43_29]OGY29487.1 MAG: hypothetical protein A3F33_00580 [Candidatus Woykebacteria bacterium RIFCSPHIGHO2_12_FULL_43_10]OGY31782.1 MAG: hypothetical protein A3A61_02165 [Candidatus Woykebacteria bacterium RIFCSPLOWO2_01_FULL_43_14]
MRIFQITPRYYPLIGGGQEVVKRYAEGLSSLGHEVVVLTSNDGSKIKKEVINGVEVRRFSKLPLPNNLPYQPITPGLFVELLREKADIYHVHGNKWFTSDIAGLVLNKKSGKLVFTPLAGQFGTSLLGRLHNQLLGGLTFGAQLVLPASEFEKGLLVRGGIDPKNMKVFPHGVDLEEFKNTRKGFFDNIGWKETSVVISVSRLVPHKNIDLLIKAVGLLAKRDYAIRLAVVGPDGGEGERLKNLVQSLNLADKIIFLGGLSREKMIEALTGASVFCLPSSSESFGIAYIDALAARVPVVATNLCATPEIIKDGENGLLCDLDEKSIALKIETLLKDKSLAKKFADNGYRTVQEKYNWDKIIKKLEGLYTELL